MFKSFFLKKIGSLLAALGVFETLDRVIVSQSLLHARENRKKEKIHSLQEVEFRGYSQWGEDGILDWLVEKIPAIPETFVEFGVENYKQSNTRLLLWLRNWRGLVMDGSESHVKDIQKQDVSWRFSLTSKCAFIDRENINQLLRDSGFVGEVGILSVDIDGNDYWVWEAINEINPVIVVCEYNAVFGDVQSLTIPYDPTFYISKGHYSNLYYGASIQALIGLAAKKGYSFVGTGSNACNAFFVRNDQAQGVLSRIGTVSISCSHFRTSRNEFGALTFVDGMQRIGVIKHLPVYNVKTNKVLSISECGQLYSEGWGE